MRKKAGWIFLLLLLIGMLSGLHQTSKKVSMEVAEVFAQTVLFQKEDSKGTYEKEKVGQKKEKKQTQVWLDAGHGGGDSGKVGVNGAYEKDINLKIVKKLKKLLEKKGISVRLTRKTDEGLYSAYSTNKKLQDMQRRVEMINEDQPTMAVSIHQNSYPEEYVRGAQVFYYEGSAAGQEIAGILQDNLAKLDPEHARKEKSNQTYYMLRRTTAPIVIVECGFLSNWEEAEKLVTKEYQNQVAQNLCDGICECLEKLEGKSQ